MDENDDFFKYVGKFIGKGQSRLVYLNNMDDKTIVKIRKKDKYLINNIIEYGVWDKYKNTPFSKFLCPIVNVSDDKKYIIMKKALIIHKKSPTEYVENFKKRCDSIIIEIKNFCSKLTDFDYNNFGIYNDNLVLIDYGHKSFGYLLKNNIIKEEDKEEKTEEDKEEKTEEDKEEKEEEEIGEVFDNIDNEDKIYTEKILKKIGNGFTRRVFSHKYDENIVIKMIKKNDYNENNLEYLIWKKYENKAFSKYLCPVLEISNNKKFLIMKKALRISKKNFNEDELKKLNEEYEKVKREMLDFCSKLVDLKLSNFAVYENRVVMIDYAHGRMKALLDDSKCRNKNNI
jgi:hypothetical protein